MARVKRNNTKFKMTKHFAYLIAFVVIIIALSIILIQPSASERIYRSYTADAGSSLTQEHVFVKISLNKLEKKIKKNGNELLYVYYGSPDCSNCVSNIQTFNSMAQNFDIEEVFYLDSSFISEYDEDDEEDAKKVSAMEAKVGFDLYETPSLIVYKNGVVVFDSADYKDEETESMSVSWKLIAQIAFGTDF